MHAKKVAAALLLVVAALSACTDSGPGGEAPGRLNPGGGAGGADSSGSGGAAGETEAGEGGASGTAGVGGMSAGGGGESGDQGGSGGMVIGGAGGTGGDAGGDPADAGMGPDTGFDPDGCVVARRIDECCQPWIAVEQTMAQAEPCIVALGEPWPTEDCTPPASCALVDCAVPPPTSREVLRADDACMFTDECATAADCVLATESTSCCACLGSMPKSIVDQELCITAEGETPDFAACGGDNCFAVLCAECEAPAEPTCALSDGYKRCH
jgi:hypothetical protein